MRESISISLPEEIKAELDRFTASRGVTRSDVVRQAIADYLFVETLRALRAGLMPYAEAKGIYTDDDVFRELA